MDGNWKHFRNTHLLRSTNSRQYKEKALVENPGKAAISSLVKAPWGFMGRLHEIIAWRLARARG
jgi:hypothetical protein